MRLNTVKMLGISISTDSKKVILKYIRKYLTEIPNPTSQIPSKTKKPLVIVTPNPEQLVLAMNNERFAKLLNEADVAVPDGIGIVVAQRLLRTQNSELNDQKVIQRIPGVELVEDLVAIAADRGIRTGLIGGRDRVALEALECLQEKYSGLSGWAITPEEVDMQKIVQKIVQTNTRIVFVGLGAPKQEYFIKELTTHNSQLTTPLIFMSVGGSFDIIAGRTPRAPVFMRSIGFEWFWRLIQEPWRIGRQFALIKFLWLVCRERLVSKEKN